MIFRNKHGFWQRRGIISLEERESIGDKNPGLQGLRDQRRTDPQAQTGTASRPPVRDTPPSEEEGRQ